MAAFTPGLKVQAAGTYSSERRVVATSVKFRGDVLEQAQAIQAGMHETKMQAQENKAEMQRQAAELKAQKGSLRKAAGAVGRTASQRRRE